MAEVETRKKAGCGTAVLAIIGGVFVLGVIGSLVGGDDPAGNSTAATGDKASLSASEQPAPAAPSSGWIYDSRTDPLTDKVSRTACVRSDEKLTLGFPYGNVYAELCLRDDPKLGKDAYVQLVGDGQFVCRSYDGCSLKVRFDKGAVQTFSGTGAADYSSNIVFFENRPRLEAGVKAADRTIVEASFYQAGNQAMTFNTAGFAWPKAPTPS